MIAKYSPEERTFILENYKGIGNKELANLINKKFNKEYTANQMRWYKKNHHLDSGLTGRFEKGHTTFNKGKKWDDYMSKESQRRSSKTTFKKGNIPHNHKEVGSERITVDGFIEIKVAEPNKWRIKSNVIYEEYHKTKIPKGYKIIYLDGNKLNIDPANLKMVSNAEELIMNKNNLRYDKKELTEVGHTIAKIIDKRNKLKQEVNNERKYNN